MQAIFNFFDKNYIDQVNYVTDPKSSTLCDALLAFHPDTAPSARKPFILDDATREQVHQAFEREQKILYTTEDAIIEKDSHAPIESILKGTSPAYYSPNNLAIMYGYLIATIKINAETATILQAAAKLKKSPTIASISNSASTDPQTSTPVTSTTLSTDLAAHVSTQDLSPSSLEQEILKGNNTYAKKFGNLIRKSISKPLDYLTNSKAATVADAIALFHPDHPQKRAFNRTLPLDKALLHQAFERQIRLHALIENALKTNDHQTMLTLHQKARKGYFSKISEAVLAGYLQFAAEKSAKDNAARQATAENSRKDSGGKTALLYAPAGKSIVSYPELNCMCNPPKLLKDCSACLMFSLQIPDLPPPPAPPTSTRVGIKSRSINLNNSCNCKPPKPLTTCAICLTKLEMEQQLAASSTPYSTVPLFADPSTNIEPSDNSANNNGGN